MLKQTKELERPDDETQKESLRFLVQNNLNHDEQIQHIMNLSIGHLSVDVIAYAVELFRKQMHKVDLPGSNIVDLCGTGGDHSGSFNISTTASFVVAGAGIPIAKHGNVSITSKSGSIDVLKALDVTIPETPDQAKIQFDRAGLCFLFAPYYHPAFARFAPARKELALRGERTIFNILGPLLNPASVKRMAMGVFRPDFVNPLAQVMLCTGMEKALVFSGDGLDELTLTAPNTACEIKNKSLHCTEWTHQDFNLKPCDMHNLKGGTPIENAKITYEILTRSELGPKRDMTILNAAAAIYTAKDNSDFPAAIALATQSLESGAALKVLEACRA